MSSNIIYPFTTEQINVLRTIITITNSLSFIGCILVLVPQFIRRTASRFPSSLLNYFTISALIVAFSLLMSAIALAIDAKAPDDYQGYCVFQAILLQYFLLAAVFWWFIITLNFYLIVCKEKDTTLYIRIYHIVAWGCPFILTLLPLATNLMGPISPFWCWIKDHDASGVHKPGPVFGYFYIEVGLLITFGITLWSIVFRKLYQVKSVLPENSRKPPNIIVYVRNMLFIFSLFFIFFFLFMHRVFQNLFGYYLYWSWCLYVIAVGSLGIFTFLILGLRKKNFDLLRDCVLCRLKSGYEILN